MTPEVVDLVKTGKWRQLIIMLFVYFFVSVDRKDKCPCCGILQLHPMRFDPESKKILHWCKTLHHDDKSAIGCQAIWGLDPIVNPARWEIVEAGLDIDGKQVQGQPERKFNTVSREPVDKIEAVGTERTRPMIIGERK
jgi:hypothetical protein